MHDAAHWPDSCVSALSTVAKSSTNLPATTPIKAAPEAGGRGDDDSASGSSSSDSDDPGEAVAVPLVAFVALP